MTKKTLGSKLSKNDRLYNILKLTIGVLLFLVGTIEFFSKITYTLYWWNITKGIEVQVFGSLLILYGLYLIISAVRKLFFANKEL